MQKKNVKVARRQPQQQSQQQPRQGKQSKRAPGGIRGDALAQIFQYVNPFSGEIGSKVFDESCQRTIAWRSYTVGVATPASGKLALCINPSLNSVYQFAASYSGNDVATWSAAGENATDYGTLATQCDWYRIVSWGVRVNNVSAITDASGTLYFKSFYRGVVTTSVSAPPTPAATTSLCDYTDEVPVSALTGTDYVWISKPVLANATLFQNLATIGQAAYNDGLPWNSLVIIGVDLGANVKLNFEVVYNLEVIPAPSTLGARMTTPSAPYDPVMLTKIAAVRDKMQPGYRGVVNPASSNFISTAISAAGKVLNTPAGKTLTNAAANVVRELVPGSNIVLGALGY